MLDQQDRKQSQACRGPMRREAGPNLQEPNKLRRGGWEIDKDHCSFSKPREIAKHLNFVLVIAGAVTPERGRSYVPWLSADIIQNDH